MSSTSAEQAVMSDTPQTINLTIKADYDAFARFNFGGKYLKVHETTNDRKPCYTLVSGTLGTDKRCDFMLYQVSANIYQIQNRYSGLFLYPYANGGEGAYVGQGLDTGTNMTLWEITPVPET